MILYTLLVMSILFSSVAVSALTSSKDLETRGSLQSISMLSSMQLFYLALPIISVHGMVFLSREHIGRFDAFLKRMFNPLPHSDADRHSVLKLFFLIFSSDFW